MHNTDISFRCASVYSKVPHLQAIWDKVNHLITLLPWAMASLGSWISFSSFSSWTQEAAAIWARADAQLAATPVKQQHNVEPAFSPHPHAIQATVCVKGKMDGHVYAVGQRGSKGSSAVQVPRSSSTRTGCCFSLSQIHSRKVIIPIDKPAMTTHMQEYLEHSSAGLPSSVHPGSHRWSPSPFGSAPWLLLLPRWMPAPWSCLPCDQLAVWTRCQSCSSNSRLRGIGQKQLLEWEMHYCITTTGKWLNSISG